MKFVKRDSANKIIKVSSKTRTGYEQISDEDYTTERNAQKLVYVNRNSSGKITGTQSFPNGKGHEKITGAELEIEMAPAKLLQDEEKWLDKEYTWFIGEMQKHDYGATRKFSTRPKLVTYGNQLDGHIQGDKIMGTRPVRPV